MTAEAIRLELPRPHPGQRRLLAERRRFNVACMGRRWGKTKFGIGPLASPVLAAGYPVAWFAPGYKYVSEVWREAKRYLRPLIAAKNETDKRLELITGGTLEFWTLDGPDPARGRKYRLAIIDEAAMVRGLLDRWRQAIRPTLTDYRGDAWFFSTPKGGNDFKTLYDEAGNKPHAWARWQMPTATNPHISAAELADAREDLPEIVWRQEYLAEFVDMQGLAVRREWIQDCEQLPPLSELRIGMGVDLAISTKDTADYTAVAVVGIHRDGRRFVLSVERGRLTFAQTLDFIARIARRWSPGSIRVESTQYQAAAVQELLRTTSLPIVGVKPDRDKLTRAQPMIARYERGLVWHGPEVPGYYLEELLAFPVGAHDDCVDAVGMAFDAAAAGQAGAVAAAGETTFGGGDLHGLF